MIDKNIVFSKAEREHILAVVREAVEKYSQNTWLGERIMAQVILDIETDTTPEELPCGCKNFGKVHTGGSFANAIDAANNKEVNAWEIWQREEDPQHITNSDFGESTHSRCAHGKHPEGVCHGCMRESVNGTIGQAPSPPVAPTMTLRDQFAMAALTGPLAESSHPGSRGSQSSHSSTHAIYAYQLADAMLQERSK